MKEIFKIFLSMLVVSIMLIGTVGAESTDSDKYELFEGEYYLPDYGPDSFELLNQDSNIIATWGTVPEITDDKEKVDWLATIRPCINNSKEDLLPYMKSHGGPLLGFGTNYEGYIFVEFDEESIDLVDKSVMNDIYDTITKNAKEIGLYDVPIVYRTNKEATLDSRTVYSGDLVGGIALKHRSTDDNLWYSSTLSFAAEDSNGNEGFVMTAHSVDDAGGIGAFIAQYYTNVQVGEVTYYDPYFADAAWVEATNINVADDIYYADTDVLKDVTGYGDTSQGAKVYISGITSETNYGYVTDDYITQYNPYFDQDLYYQFSADYEADGGDSGAPIFQKTLGGVKIVGVHWGHQGTATYFSPISGVIADLGITPLY
ncbi:chymotrypsin family serine protease [Methanolobus profundi]|uniref:Trypsin n=1 Tax=Methanolobus profundi TaxID=487685 RepID=A0A1I4TNP7_9EURY|nr:hypothetical protein [Methanolobus profundi]SFM78394.1 hypothetical protein SAMN04488696_2369 [Methanolobus profundi]